KTHPIPIVAKYVHMTPAPQSAATERWRHISRIERNHSVAVSQIHDNASPIPSRVFPTARRILRPQDEHDFFRHRAKRRHAAMSAVLRLINLADLLGLNIHN